MTGKTLYGFLAAALVLCSWMSTGWALEAAAKGAQAPLAGSPQAPGNITFEGGPGDTLETAIVIKGAADHMAGVAAEYHYLEKTFGRRQVDWRILRQSLVRREGKAYDLMQIELANGTRKDIYFDLSDFFGKF